MLLKVKPIGSIPPMACVARVSPYGCRITKIYTSLDTATPKLIAKGI